MQSKLLFLFLNIFPYHLGNKNDTNIFKTMQKSVSRASGVKKQAALILVNYFLVFPCFLLTYHENHQEKQPSSYWHLCSSQSLQFTCCAYEFCNMQMNSNMSSLLHLLDCTGKSSNRINISSVKLVPWIQFSIHRLLKKSTKVPSFEVTRNLASRHYTMLPIT